MKRFFTFLLVGLFLATVHQQGWAQFIGITGTGAGINYTSYGTITTNLDAIRPIASINTSVAVYQDIFVSGFNTSLNLDQARLYYKTNSATVGTINDGTWAVLDGTLAAVPADNNDRATFTFDVNALSLAGNEIMFYIRFTEAGTDYYGFNGTNSPHTTLPSMQSQMYKIRFNQATAYNTARLDGLVHEWDATTQVYARSSANASRTLDITWDADNIYFLVNSGFSASGNDRVHFGFDINPNNSGDANGTKANFNGANFPEFYRPDIIFRARGNGSSSWTNDRGVASGSNGWTYSGDIGNTAVSDVQSVSGSNTTNLEVRIKRSAIGTFTSLGIFVWFGNSSDNLYDSYPNGNPSTNALMPIQIGFSSLSNGINVANNDYADAQYNQSGFTLFGISAYRDLRISNTSGVINAINTSMTARNLQIDNGGGSFTLGGTSGSDLYLSGNFTNNGTYTDNSRATFFNGTNGEQTIGGTTATAFTNIAVQKASGGGTVKLLNNITINGWIDLEDGANNTADLNLNGFNMTLGGSAYLIEDHTNNNVIKDNTATTDTGVKGGYIEFTRTVTASIVELAGSGLTLGRTGGSDYSVTVRRYHYIPSGNTHPASPANLNRGAKKVYQITGTPSGQTTLRIDFASEELGILTSVDMLYKWNSGIGWVKATDASTTSPASGMSISTGSDFVQAVGNLISFSHWALGGNANPLPISLTSFSAEKTGNTEATLTWQTASEIQNKGFFVEKSADAQNFVSLGFVEGAGNSTTARTYQFKDHELVGKAYYRLRQVDFDGTTSFSPLAVVENDVLVVYPNPVQNRLFVSVGELASDIPARLLNAQGVEVWQGTLKGSQNVLQVSHLTRGVYFLHMVQDGKKVVKKIVLQ